MWLRRGMHASTRVLGPASRSSGGPLVRRAVGVKAESLRWREDVGLPAETPVGMFRRMLADAAEGPSAGWGARQHALEVHDAISAAAASRGGFNVAWATADAMEAARHSALGPSTADDWEARQDRLLDFIAGAKAAARACEPTGTAVVADVSSFYPFAPSTDPLARVRVPSTSLRLADAGLAGAVFNAAVHPEYIREARSELGDSDAFCLLAKLPDPSLSAVDDVHLAAASHADALVLDITEGGPPSDALVQFTREWHARARRTSPIVIVRRGMGRYADLAGLEGLVLEVHTGHLLRAVRVALDTAAQDAFNNLVGAPSSSAETRSRAPRYESNLVEDWAGLIHSGR